MKVKQLIKQLKKIPQNLEVGVAMHDNSEWETAGDVCSVNHVIKEEIEPRFGAAYEEGAFNDMPAEYVVLGC